MNRFTQLFSGEELAISQFDHPPHEAHEDPEVETATGFGIALVVRGSFGVDVLGRRQVLSAGSAFITHPDLSFSCFHTESCPTDVCISLRFEASAVTAFEAAWMQAPWRARAVAPPGLAFAHRRLWRALDRDEPLEVEHWALSHMLALASEVRTAGRRGAYLLKPSLLDAVVRVCEEIEADPTLQRSVADRARRVGLSGAMLTRVFRRLMGIAPHHYVVQQRLLRAADQLAQGSSVSDTSLQTGFGNLSYFCRAFQRAFDVPPSRWSRLSGREMRRKVQAFRGHAGVRSALPFSSHS